MITIIYGILAAAGEYLPESLPTPPPRALGQRLRWSGLADGIDINNWGRAQRSAGIICSICAFLAAPGWLAVILIVPAYLGGVRLPDIVLNMEIDRARSEIDRELPAFIENMAILTGAGLSLGLALPEAAAEVSGLLGSNLSTAVNEIRLGAPRRIALEQAAAATPSREFQRLAGLIVDAERFGTPVAAELARAAAGLRDKRMMSIREEAQKLPVKMLFPLVFMILPAFILLTAGPIFVSMT